MAYIRKPSNARKLLTDPTPEQLSEVQAALNRYVSIDRAACDFVLSKVTLYKLIKVGKLIKPKNPHRTRNRVEKVKK